MDRIYHVAQFGAFDVESMGDALFPDALSFGVRNFCKCEFDLFSVNACSELYNHNRNIYAISQFPTKNEIQNYDAIVLGGGEFLNFHEISFGSVKYPPGYLWQEPIRMAKERNIKVFINCVGVSNDFTEQECRQVQAYMQDLEYISVRDIFSKVRLRSAGIQGAVCVADNLWYMNQMYPKAQQSSVRRELETRFRLDLTTPYIVVQYGTTKDVQALAQQLRSIKAKTGFRICLMAINYCHEDRMGMQMLADAGSGEFEVLDTYLQPPEMIAVISGASAFFGTSLHGNLTAASYDVPFVGLDMYPNFVSKMDGIFSMIGCEAYLVPHESGLEAAYYARIKDLNVSMRIPEIIQDIQRKLDIHFKFMTDILKGDGSVDA